MSKLFYKYTNNNPHNINVVVTEGDFVKRKSDDDDEVYQLTHIHGCILAFRRGIPVEFADGWCRIASKDGNRGYDFIPYDTLIFFYRDFHDPEDY